MQRYDIPDPAAPDEFLPKVWSPTNSPLLDHGELVGVVHTVKEVSQSRQLLDEVARDVDHGVAWDPADLLHTLEARDTIGEAKGMLMERFNIDADRAFGLLTRLSQETNTRVEVIARNLVQTERPPRSG